VNQPRLTRKDDPASEQDETIMDPQEQARQRILTGQCWDDFCDQLKEIGHEIVLADTAPDNLLDRAEGWRYLARLTRAGLHSFLDPSTREKPEFTAVVGVSMVKIGMDNPDNVYMSARVDGRGTYRIRCQRNTVHFLGFGSQAGGYGSTGNLQTTGSFDASRVAVDDAGWFEVIACATPQPGNWLPMTADTNMIQARQTFADRANETLPVLQIERIDADMPVPPFDPLDVDRGLQGAAWFVRGTAGKFAQWAEDFRQHPNTLPRFDPEIAYAAGGDPKIAYYHSYFELQDDDALVVELHPPECEYWNFQLANYWLESLDYRYYRIHINQHTAHYNDDGSVTAIISSQDPGKPNWLNTTGHARGTMCVRWLGATEHPVPKTQVCKLAELIS
jgi:hypothetical protein